MTNLKTTLNVMGGGVAALTLLSACGHLMTHGPDS
jgi:hypothetical protein